MKGSASREHVCTEEVWLYPSETASWHFVTLPHALASRIRQEVEGRPRAGFGSIRVRVRIGESTWETSIFPDSRSKSYLLPIKASVRKREQIFAKDHVTLYLAVLER